MNRERRKLEHGEAGLLKLPDPVPTDTEELLDLMDYAAKGADRGMGAGSGYYDNGMLIFNLLNAHYQVLVARKLVKAHEDLKCATNRLNVATWGLAAVTVLLIILELFKVFMKH